MIKKENEEDLEKKLALLCDFFEMNGYSMADAAELCVNFIRKVVEKKETFLRLAKLIEKTYD